MKKFLLLLALSSLWATSVFASGTINYGSRAGMQVTVVSEAGLDTSHAVIQTRHTREDATVFCRDYVNENPVTEKCIRDELAVRLNDAIYADCARGIFTDFYGDRFQYRGKNHHPGEFGPKYILMDLRTHEIESGDSASGYPIDMEIFRALCPRTAPPDEFETPLTEPDEHKVEKYSLREIKNFTCSGKVGSYSVDAAADRSIGSGDSMCYFASDSAVGRIILKTCPVGTECNVIGTVQNREGEGGGDWSPIISTISSVVRPK